MPNNFFLKLDGVLGGSEDPRHRGEMDIKNFSWGFANHSGAGAGGHGAGKVQVDKLTITKPTDNASPLLAVYSAEGRYIKQAVLTIEDISGRGSVRSMNFKMNDVLIESARPVGSGPDDDVGVDEVVLTFAVFVPPPGAVPVELRLERFRLKSVF